MPRIIPEQEYERLLEILQSFPDGVSISALLAVEEIDYPKRTLQRRLDSMLASGMLFTQGATRSLKYHSAAGADGQQPERPEFSGNPPETSFKTDAVPCPNSAPDPAPVSPLPKARSEGNSPVQFANQTEGHQAIILPVDIPYSFEAKSIRTSVTRPISHRHEVGHKLALLDYYIPNQSNYLNLALRQELAAVGQLGASQSPAGTYLRQNMERFTLDLSWNSSRLEGNSYSLQETQRLLTRAETVAGKGAEEAQMLLNHQAAVEMLAAQAGEIRFDRHTICNLHGLLADNLLPDPATCGRLRRREIRMPSTAYTPLQVPGQIEARFDQILTKASAIEDPFEQAFFMIVHLPYLQPFEHLNNNVARLAANIPLVHFNLCPVSFVDVPKDDYVQALLGVYELNRVDFLRDLFVWAYKRTAAYYAVAREYLGEPDPFRLKYRSEIRDLVRIVVRSGKNPSESGHLLRQEVTQHFDRELQSQFLDVVETELASLHEGNIARYRLKSAEFDWWQSQKNAPAEPPASGKKNDASQLDFDW